MAADEDRENGGEQEGQAKPSAGKKRLILLILLALFLVGFSVGGTLLALKFFGGASEPVVAESENEEEAPEPPPAPAIYYPIKPAIIVNFSARGRQRYLQADITLMTRENEVISAIELHMPKVRSALNILIGGQTYEEIQTAEGKELLRQKCLQEIQRIMQEEIGKPGVEQVLFTNFVMQ